jgi:predicted PurR-regulated permease PerM
METTDNLKKKLIEETLTILTLVILVIGLIFVATAPDPSTLAKETAKKMQHTNQNNDNLKELCKKILKDEAETKNTVINNG